MDANGNQEMRTRKLCGEEIGMRNKVTVSIGGKEYTMVASEDEGYVRKCAALVDRQALYEELQTGRFSAALDVYHTEPLPAEDVLRRDMGYLGWILQGDFPSDTKRCFQAIRARIDSRHPGKATSK